MSVYGLVVGRNETTRYLQSCLKWNVPIFDRVLYYDDQSQDESVAIAQEAGCEVIVRSKWVPTFMEHEGAFRQHSLDSLDDLFHPVHGEDWVFVFDTDEFLVSSWEHGDTRSLVNMVIDTAQETNAGSVRIARPEFWEVNARSAFRRTDGFWGGMTCVRLFRWYGPGQLRNKAMGCGTEPNYVFTRAIFTGSYPLHLLHYGYVDNQDLKDKYERYSTIEHGHNDGHIQSIVQKPRLEPWHGAIPNVWRGIR